MENRQIADRLDAFASLLELADASPYSARAYRRAAETIRGAPVPVAELVRTGRVRELRGIGAGIETRLRELVETGDIAELAELEREAQLREALAADGQAPAARRGLTLNRARELVGGIATALGGEPAGDVRRWRDSNEAMSKRPEKIVTLSLDERLRDSERRATSMSLPLAVHHRLDVIADLAKDANASRGELVAMLIADAKLDPDELERRVLAHRKRTVGDVIPQPPDDVDQPAEPGAAPNVVSFPVRPPGRPSQTNAG